MNNTARIKKNFTFIKYQKLITVSVLVGFLSSFLAISLKRLTEHYEEIFLDKANLNNVYFIVLPAIGLSVIYFLRHYLFKKKENKGIREIFDTTAERKNSLPLYKIPSHFINGLITVVFGGSTGIEVSTVVASATIGSVAQEKENVFNRHKTELICAGVAAGITALFCSPFAGILFAWEVISKKISKTFLITGGVSVAVALGFIYFLNEKPLFTVTLNGWHWQAIPYFILLGIIAGMNSVYLTKCVLFFKKRFGKIEKHPNRIFFAAVILSVSLLLLPQLYGEGYHAIKENIVHSNDLTFTITLALTFLGIIIMKPIVTSATLAAGGDGGVFAPSIFIGGFVGLLLAICLNTFFDAGVIPLNFMILGMGAMLSASIHAPLTAIFLTCGLVNDYSLFIPICIVCLVAKYTAKMIYPFTVYTYQPKPTL
ncbi:chloride channel protein [Flavobacterium humi]|uniref:Chloride channel protein n=1 Tax=Flavobacterium humi TaxID=2562683 RepID=A0A4Z0L8I0_9FLAO|nr:chloride channel protein [Flavobacterium humi]TGD58094.1 chloride channel protein [Flavobacterium humi]